jgi:hypothetical protein
LDVSRLASLIVSATSITARAIDHPGVDWIETFVPLDGHEWIRLAAWKRILL